MYSLVEEVFSDFYTHDVSNHISNDRHMTMIPIEKGDAELLTLQNDSKINYNTAVTCIVVLRSDSKIT